MGFSRAALHAGYHPKNTPMAELNSTASVPDEAATGVSQPSARPVTWAMPVPGPGE